MNRHQEMSSLSSGGSKGHQVYGWDKKQIKHVYEMTVSADNTTATWGAWGGYMISSSEQNSAEI